MTHRHIKDTRCGSEYKKIKMSDINQFVCQVYKVNNGLLNDMKNDLFQVYVYSPVFFHDFFKIPSFAIFIPQPQSPFYEQLQ